MSSKKATPPEKLIANAVYAQIANGLEQEALDTIDGNVGALDFASTHGMYKDTLLTAALSNDLEKVAAKIIKISEVVKGVDINIDHKNEMGEYAFLLACKKGYIHLALAILKKGTTLCAPDTDGFTPLMYACGRTDMVRLVEYIVKHNAHHKTCDIGYANDSGTTALSVALENGIEKTVNLLLDSGKSNPGSILKEYNDVTVLQRDLYEGIQTAKLILEKTGMDCNPLYISKKDRSTALLLAMPTFADLTHVDDHVDVIQTLLYFADQEPALKYVDYKNTDGFAAFDLLFEVADIADIPVNTNILKLFIDFYYKNHPNSKVFLRNIDKICEDGILIGAIRKMYPGKKTKKILKHLCKDVVETHVTVEQHRGNNSSPAIQTGKRIPMVRTRTTPLEEAEEIPIVHAEEEVSPMDTGFYVGDPRDRGIRQTKRLGGKRRKTLKKKGRKQKP
jgi:hypothetical protein